MVLRPLPDLGLGPRRPPVAVGSPSVAVLEEALVLALELFFKHDSKHSRTVVLQPFGGPEVGAKELRVVREVAVFGDARVEDLAGLGLARSVTFQHVPATIGQRDDRRALASIEGGHSLHETRTLQALEVSMAHIACPASVVAQVVRRDRPERTDGRE